ncbi:MAG TPA: hypothetical protein VFD08_05905 [Clostridia bacterium]|nr:hypothetical protein [Clostridia bacterium]
MKRRLLAGLLIIICLLIQIHETKAYFSTEKTLHKVITTGGIKIELLEWEDESKIRSLPKNSTEGVMPGREIVKIFQVENTGKNEAYIRIQMEKDIGLKGKIGEEPNLNLMIVNLESSAWTLAEEGFYYYKKVLKPGEKTEPFYLTARFDRSMGNIFQDSRVKVSITAQATQVANNGNSSLKAKGWPD